MSIEQPKSNPWENKQSPAFKNWLVSNVSQSPESWDSLFLQYVDIRWAENKKRTTERREASLEATDQEIYEGYLRRMDIKEDFLKGKKVLDMGCRNGAFVRTCLENNISDEMYGIDKELIGEATSEKYLGHFFESDFQDGIPVHDLDLIVMKASIHYLFSFEKDGVTRVCSTLEKALDELNSSGEIRIGPIIQGILGWYPDADYQKTLQVIEELSKKRNIEYELVPVDISVWERKHPHREKSGRVATYDSVLVIRHAQKEE